MPDRRGTWEVGVTDPRRAAMTLYFKEGERVCLGLAVLLSWLQRRFHQKHW